MDSKIRYRETQDMNRKNLQSGAFLISRSIFISEVSHKSPEHFKIFIYMIGNAQHTRKIIKGIQVERGQLLTSYRKLNEWLEYKIGNRTIKPHEQRIKKIIHDLKRLNLIITKKVRPKEPPVEPPVEPDTILVTLLQYNVYQDLKLYEGTAEGTAEGTTTPSKTNANNALQGSPRMYTRMYVLGEKESSVCSRSGSRASGKSRKERGKKTHTQTSFSFSPPKIEEIKIELINQGCSESEAEVEAGKFLDYNEMLSWKIKSLATAVKIWIKNMEKFNREKSRKPGKSDKSKRDPHGKYKKLMKELQNERKNSKR